MINCNYILQPYLGADINNMLLIIYLFNNNFLMQVCHVKCFFLKQVKCFIYTHKIVTFCSNYIKMLTFFCLVLRSGYYRYCHYYFSCLECWRSLVVITAVIQTLRKIV